MGRETEISWCDSTFNPWIGCTKISVGERGACVNCYAEVATPTRALGIKFGVGKRRHRTSPATWALPLRYERNAYAFHAVHGRRQRVFCASLADVFDNEIDPQWRADLFDLVRATPSLDWLMLSKRIGNARDMLPADWGAGYPNVWLGSTVVTQQEVDRDVPKLLSMPARVRFLSCEPLMERIDLLYPDSLFPKGPRTCCDGRECGCMGQPIDPPLLFGISWVITGGESGSNARPSRPGWFRSLRDDCVSAGVAFHFKQWGEWLPGHQYTNEHRALDPELEQSRYQSAQWDGDRWDINHIVAGEEYDEHALYRVGKLAAGRILDGRTWDQFPEVT